jgi:hypothetical protein
MGNTKRRATPGPGLTVPYAAREYIRIRITKAWELRAGLVNPNSYPLSRDLGMGEDKRFSIDWESVHHGPELYQP